MNSKLPILYSFRRCPYAIRARLAIIHSDFKCELREIDLKCKPDALLQISPKGTVPVLVLPNGEIIDESLDIIEYVMSLADQNIWADTSEEQRSNIKSYIYTNDNEFAPLLHFYKYYERYPERTQLQYRDDCEALFISPLEKLLANSSYLFGDELTIGDVAIFPHMRQFSMVEAQWFEQSSYPNILRWLDSMIKHDVFEKVMVKHQPWQEGDNSIVFPVDL